MWTGLGLLRLLILSYAKMTLFLVSSVQVMVKVRFWCVI